jgi:hypothetical protein
MIDHKGGTQGVLVRDGYHTHARLRKPGPAPRHRETRLRIANAVAVKSSQERIEEPTPI